VNSAVLATTFGQACGNWTDLSVVLLYVMGCGQRVSLSVVKSRVDQERRWSFATTSGWSGTVGD